MKFEEKEILVGDLNLDLIINSTNIGLIAVDADCRVIFFNKYAMEYLLLDEKDIIRQPISMILSSAPSIFEKCIQTGKPYSGLKLLGKKGNIIGNITPIKKGNRVAGAVCTFMGATDIEHTAIKLDSYKNLSQELEAVFSSTTYGSWLCNGDGTIIKLNEAAEILNGIKAKDIVGKKAWYLVEKGWTDRSATGEVLKTKQRVSFIQHMKNTKKDLMVTATPVFDQAGNLFRVVVNEKDITALSALRRQLERSQSVTARTRDELLECNLLELKDQEIIAESEAMKQVLRISFKLARHSTSGILILGESGVGKGLIAKFIHKNSSNQNMPFVQINCAALPETLLEAELFGYKKGAFTGADDRGKIGLIELAQNGTLFLDEIGDIPLSIQIKLLNYLDDHLVRPLGGVRSKKINCVVIAATNRDLDDLIKQGRFREDLFYRLNSFTVTIPPIRQRKEDIFELVNFFLQKFNETYKLKRRFSSRLIRALQSYQFPGNVRELGSIVKQAVVMSDDEIIDEFILTSIGKIDDRKLNKSYDEKKNLSAQVKNLEKEILEKAVLKYKTTREMAHYLGVNQSTVVRKMKKYGLISPSMH